VQALEARIADIARIVEENVSVKPAKAAA
jgi:hypothetical protein